jgi:hypothetical protein
MGTVQKEVTQEVLERVNQEFEKEFQRSIMGEQPERMAIATGR